MTTFSDIRHREFGSTDWSIVRQLDGPEAEQALAKLCEQYWQPLYAYARSRVRDVHKAQDLTQRFFAHVVAKDSLRQAAPDRGRFRSFLLASLKNFMANDPLRLPERGQFAFRRLATTATNSKSTRPSQAPTVPGFFNPTTNSLTVCGILKSRWSRRQRSS